MRARLKVVVLAAVLFARAAAQDRPSEDDLFGKPPEKPAAEKPAAAAQGEPAAGGHGDTEAELFGQKKPAEPAPAAPPGTLIPREREDWLKVGGELQLRAQASAYQDTAPKNWPYGSPNLLDVYLDSRPNDRVRGFVLGRLNYDPTLPTTHAGSSLVPSGSGGGGSTSTGFGGTSSSDNPGGVLDQLWVNFDPWHRIFVTAGRQHVKWGVGHFWNPTDYLHPVKRDPLATFDVRTGTTLVKVHVPWEKRGWNVYGIGLFEDLAGDTTNLTSRLGRIGGGGRAEVVLGPAELGLDAIAQQGHRPRYGIDLSGGVLNFDLYTEVALRSGGDGQHWVRPGAPVSSEELLNWVPEDRRQLTPQVVVGGTWMFKYSDEDYLTVGGEYFYNDLGYDHKDVYPFLLAGAPNPGLTAQQDPRAFQPFYLGRHYAAVNLSLPKPGRFNDTNLLFTVIGNLSDRSYVARFDASVLVLTYLTVETFVAGHFGNKGGEFRLTLPSEVAAAAQAETGATFPTGAPLFDVGVALRVAL
ncbi:MAG TPA: hypothetical protein VFG59_05225 [Anaeromyxobacter sp.]|nr:hypothetical protein [Anaeromyxobacter sp.]